jgi:heptosyltransferase II
VTIETDRDIQLDLASAPDRALGAGSALVTERAAQILIVKLGWTETLVKDQGTTCSLGDVLRTTPILHLFMDSYVVWLTDSRAAPLLPGPPYIDELLLYGPDTYRQLVGREFDQVINLECHEELSQILQGVRCDTWHGFPIRTGEQGNSSSAVEEGLLTEISSGKTWSEVLFEMLGARYEGESMVLGHVRPADVTYDIGLNLHVGSKWPTKAWPRDRWQELAQILQRRYRVEFQQYLNDLSGYVDWINRGRLLVTNDSLGLHIGQALGKKMVALFGPTSSEIIPLMPGTIFLHAEPRLACRPCYRSHCDRGLPCLMNIHVSDVVAAVERLLEGDAFSAGG